VLIVGAVAVVMENFVISICFAVGLMVLVVVDAIFVSYLPAIICGCLAVAFGLIFAFKRK